MNYFSDKELGAKPSNNEDVSVTVWNGIVAVFEQIVSKNGFSVSFPEICSDNGRLCGFNSTLFADRLKAEIPNLPVPIERIGQRKNKFLDFDDLEAPTLPDKYDVLDFIEFCFLYMRDVSQDDYHPYFHHYHLITENSSDNKNSFRSQINLIFDRNGLVFHLDDNGNIKRKVPAAIESIYRKKFKTSDDTTNNLLSEACELIVSVRNTDRQRAIEKIWDAFERIKTHHDPDKKRSADTLLDNASSGSSAFKELLVNESKALTDIGNRFQIRHFETGKEKIDNAEHFDWLFSRMFSFLNLMLVDLEKKS